jgi:hypothetical protein
LYFYAFVRYLRNEANRRNRSPALAELQGFFHLPEPGIQYAFDALQTAHHFIPKGEHLISKRSDTDINGFKLCQHLAAQRGNLAVYMPSS